MEDRRYHNIIHHLILEHLGKAKRIRLRVSGKSMHPLVKDRDLIEVEKCNPRALSIGDIITFKRNEKYFTHRVLWVTNEGKGIKLITKGDMGINVDPLVSPIQIVGKVLAIKSADRTFNLETPYWHFINRLLGITFLVETIFMLSYRFERGKFHPSRTFAIANSKPSHLYHRLRSRGLNLITGIIMKRELKTPPKLSRSIHNFADELIRDCSIITFGVLNIKPLSLSILKILKKGQNNRKSLDKSKLIKEKMPKCPNNDRNSTSESGGNFY